MPHQHSRPWLAIALLLLLAASPLAAPLPILAAPPLPATASIPPNLEPGLLKAALESRDGGLRFIVHLRQQASLSAVAAPPAASGLTPAAIRAQRQATVQAVVDRLQSTAITSQAALLSTLAARQSTGAVQRYESLWVINAVAVTANRETLFALAARPEVGLVTLDHYRQWITSPPEAEPVSFPTTGGLPEWNVQRIRADQVWAALGLSGSGVVVANIDTGVDWNHPALQASYRGYHAGGLPDHTGNWYDATDGRYLYPADGHGHGTHTMGTLVGAGGIGVAPGARWIAARAFDSTGNAYDSWIHAAIQWVLAPAGNPALAPDVVNNSWGSPDGSSETFRPDLQALRAAGIFVVFSNGNDGPGPSSVGSPASLPEAFSVGAVDSSDFAATFSSRGPSPWGEVRPLIAAPGVNVRSSTPGGAYQEWNGTSMAAPHAAGTAALLLQVQPGLSITATAFALTSTAVPLYFTVSDTIPNNTYGWGRLDALSAVLSVANSGSLTGTVLATGGQPIAQATVSAWSETTSGQASALADAAGRYALPLAAGPYTVTASAFGYTASAPARIVVSAGAVTQHDFSLDAMPTGVLQGSVLEEGTGNPLAATVSISGAALAAQTDPNTGVYSMTTPVGIYTLHSSSWGHRVVTREAVVVTAGETTSAFFSLPTGPNVLLVDSGAWYNDSHAAAYQRALAALGYVYATRTITVPASVPVLADLLPYDVVIWSAPQDSPGIIGADAVIKQYLDQGGRLLISGQDVAYWDGGGSASFYSSYFSDYLHARYIADQASSGGLGGVPQEPFAGMTLTLNTADSDRNQTTPDVVTPYDRRSAPVFAYNGGQTAALRADVCLPYRVLYFSFGLEGAGPAANRQTVLDQGITWLMASRPQRQLELTPASQLHIRSAPALVTGTLSLWNTGRLTDTYDLAATGSPWPVTLWDGAFQSRIPGEVTVPACQVITVGVAITIPYDTARDVTNAISFTATSASSPTVSRTVSFTAKTPAPVLLVDDDRWYEMEGAYMDALAANGRAYDLWDTQARGGPGAGDPDARTLTMYPTVIWFTAYDWFQPLTPANEADLSVFLQGGGRLFLSSQDYLFVSGLTPFGAGYLGVLTYTNDITAVTETGVAGSPIGGGLGPFTLTLPYHEWPDVVTPTLAARAAFVNSDGAATSLSVDGGSFRSVFFSFPYEGLPIDARNEVLRRILTWFQPVHASTFAVDRAEAPPGGALAYSLILSNPGQVTATVRVTNTLPSAVTLTSGPSGGSYDPGSHAITWSGDLPPGGQQSIGYRVVLAPSFRGILTNTAVIATGDQGAFTRTARTTVRSTIYLPLVFRAPAP
jgi:uncharacterized repeat protein (TIGR01451 family)